MKLSNKIFLLCMMFLFEVGGCVTAGDVMKSKYDDPTEVKTIEETTEATPADANIEEYKRQIAILQGQLEESQHLSAKETEQLKKKISDLEAKNEPIIAPEVKSDASATGVSGSNSKVADILWKSIVELVQQKKYTDALVSTELLLKEHQKYRKYYIGLITKGILDYNLENYSQSVLDFNKIIDLYPNHKSTVMAWYGAGASLEKMKKDSDAKLFYEEVIKTYAGSPQAKKAKLRLDKKSKIESDLFEAFPSWWSAAVK